MDRTTLDPIAQCMLHGYLDAAAFSRQFADEYGAPPTTMTKVHYFRSVTQMQIARNERFVVAADYAEYGKVQFTDTMDGRSYLVRSDSSNLIERARLGSNQLFPFEPKYLTSDVALLIYGFNKHGMDLSISGTKQRADRTRLEPTGEPQFIGQWTYDSLEGTVVFDQDEGRAFDDLGKLVEDDEASDG